MILINSDILVGICVFAMILAIIFIYSFLHAYNKPKKK